MLGTNIIKANQLQITLFHENIDQESSLLRLKSEKYAVVFQFPKDCRVFPCLFGDDGICEEKFRQIFPLRIELVEKFGFFFVINKETCEKIHTGFSQMLCIDSFAASVKNGSSGFNIKEYSSPGTMSINCCHPSLHIPVTLSNSLHL